MCRGVGSLWGSILLDGSLALRSFAYVPSERWAHIYMETTTPNFAGNFVMMSDRSATGSAWSGSLQACLTDLAVWNRALLPFETSIISSAFKYNDPGLSSLLAYYAMEETQGSIIKDRSRLAGDGVLVG